MVKITFAGVPLALAAIAAASPDFEKRQASSSRSASRGSSTAAGAVAAAPTSTFTGSLPASVSSILAGVSSGPGATTSTTSLFTTYAAGAKNPQVTGAPGLPDVNSILPSNFPTLDVIPPTDSPQVQRWISQIDWSKVPNVTTTVDSASCGSNPTNLAQAGPNGNCWWTCGQCTRSTDITTCPDTNTWGLSYDDGPSPYTPTLLQYLNQNNLKSTFFVVGSRVISRPQMVQTEFQQGHQISVHTWSHRALTTLTNEQIVAELGWTKEVIRSVIGVTPNTMRPPYGDIDDRVRAISLQMGLTPIIWTTPPGGEPYDTNDWRIAAGVVSPAEVVYTFESIIKNASSLSTGYIVLAHDLYQQAVDIAVNVVLPAAAQMSPKQNLMPIVQCLKKPASDAYVETYSNSSGSLPNETGASGTHQLTSTKAAAGSLASSTGGAGTSAAAIASMPSFVLPTTVLGAVMLFFGLLV
ncbi:putative Chitin deacetylase [Mycosarcoma maydis]|uniref:chitin deacetylase n=1 Tax=Mycosarcoma maydis TaxID=5270 RepID=A0A0D1E904_MYCMD|nr:putative Chitin deacetylase [Ustilago maydis 521]KIS70875.1 putative Chitin deacetylase [Ustilago maydis 521]|eukprot:XP_011387928.1 putative Chitin deacetylase [Ustilago maydis 521]